METAFLDPKARMRRPAFAGGQDTQGVDQAEVVELAVSDARMMRIANR